MVKCGRLTRVSILTSQRHTYTHISRSLFLKGVQCHKALFLAFHEPHLRKEPSLSRTILRRSTLSVFEEVRRTFPGLVLCPGDGDDNPETRAHWTFLTMNNGVTAIEGAVFVNDGMSARTDIITRGKEGGWALYGVKGSTKVKEIYRIDCAFQQRAMERAGVPPCGTWLIIPDNRYVRHDVLDPLKLFRYIDVTDDARRRAGWVDDEICIQKTIVDGSMPDITIGPQCRKPRDCEFRHICWKDVDETSVFSLKGNRNLVFSLFRQGIRNLEDIPDDDCTALQREQIEAFRSRSTVVRQDQIRRFLGTLHYPLYFLDFETFSLPLPSLPGTRPFQQIPFQYSLHWQERQDGPLFHDGYVGLPGRDPRPEILGRLAEIIPPGACVVAYVARFEKQILSDLAAAFPDRAGDLKRLSGAIVDMALPFQKRYLYHWKFHGSYSLKTIVPVLVPEIDYHGLRVRNGEMAAAAFFMMEEADTIEEREQIAQDLGKYCRLDTLAMVRLVDVLREHAR